MVGEDSRNEILGTLLMFTLALVLDLDLAAALALFIGSFVVLLALQVARRLFQEVKVGFEHDEATIGSLADELVLLESNLSLAIAVLIPNKICWVEGLHNFEFALQLTMADLVPAILLVLVAELVDSDLPALQQVSRTLSYLLIDLSFATGVELKDSSDVGTLQVFDFDG